LHLAKQFEKAGDYEAAYEALAAFWLDRPELPNLVGHSGSVRAVVDVLESSKLRVIYKFFELEQAGKSGNIRPQNGKTTHEQTTAGQSGGRCGFEFSNEPGNAAMFTHFIGRR
jgi:hypothetical protein